jgi:hypothetical protein
MLTKSASSTHPGIIGSPFSLSFFVDIKRVSHKKATQKNLSPAQSQTSLYAPCAH